MSVESIITMISELAEKQPEAVSALFQGTPEDMLAMANNRGINATMEDVQTAGKTLNQMLQDTATESTDGELGEQDLEAVAGGVLGGGLIGARDLIRLAVMPANLVGINPVRDRYTTLPISPGHPIKTWFSS